MTTATQIFNDIKERQQVDMESGWSDYKKLLVAMANNTQVDIEQARQLLESLQIDEDRLASDVAIMTKRIASVADVKAGAKAAKESADLNQEVENNRQEFQKYRLEYEKRQKELSEKINRADSVRSKGDSAERYLTDHKNLLDPKLRREIEENKEKRKEVHGRVRSLEERLNYLSNQKLKLWSDEDEGRAAPSSIERDKKEAARLEEEIKRLRAEIAEIQTTEVGQLDADSQKIRERMLKS